MKQMKMKTITGLVLQNFRGFQVFSTEFSEDLNILIGDNEAGKSTILFAIDLLLSGSRTRIESIGLENLFNTQAIQAFFANGRHYFKLPVLCAEIYFSDLSDEFFNGRNNSLQIDRDGIRLRCKPNDGFSPEIMEILSQPGDNFPFEYYDISYETFAARAYYGPKKPIKWAFIDTTAANSDHATREYIKSMYQNYLDSNENAYLRNQYRKSKKDYSENVLKDINKRIAVYKFEVKNNSRANLETDLTITENGVSIENKGKGKQCFVKARFALNRNNKVCDLVLIEEPENHLSHANMKRLIETIRTTQNRQTIITTHNPLICSRLDLRKIRLVSLDSTHPTTLDDVSEKVAKFFMKAPDNNILEFILSSKAILVEGDAEYILMELFYQKTTGNKPEMHGIHIISVNGTGFKNYLEVASILKKKTAVIRDNDGDYQSNCIDNYSNYADTNVKIFYDKSNTRSTFEICIYEDNKHLCEDLFSGDRRRLSVQSYMLNNKSEAAFQLLDKGSNEIAPPSYIVDAIKWISA